MASFQHVFVVVDPTSEVQSAIKRGVEVVADSKDARLHAFLCDYSSEQELADASSKSEAKHALLHRSETTLRQLVEGLPKLAAKVSKETYWNQDWPKSVVLASGRKGADIVVKAMSPLREKKLRFKSSDRYLLRNTSCPVLLVLPERTVPYNKILLALDLESSDEAHLRLNHAAISWAKQLEQSTGGELYLVAAYVDRINENLLEEGDAVSLKEQVANLLELDSDRVILEQGAAKDIILQAASSLDADVLVLGTSARKGLAGALIGNTAEKVLAEIPCDVLAVK
jgi:universal stress protein E